MTVIFDLVNKNLRRLDNGGYEVKFNGTIQRFENSDVEIENTYVDRTDGNKTKTFDSSNMFSHVFTFQEAVEKMRGRCEPIITDDPCSTRHDVHVRMLAILASEITKGPGGAAEVFLLLPSNCFSYVCFKSQHLKTLDILMTYKEHCICDFNWFGCVLAQSITVR